jgi:hypothetical protein
VETIVAPNINVVKKGVLIGFATKLGSGSSGVLAIRNLSQSLALPIVTIRVVGIPQMAFTNLITITHVNRTTDRPLMNSMVTGRCRSTNVVHPRRGYRKPIVVTTPIFSHKDGHYVRPNRVFLSILISKKMLIQMLC